MMLDILSMPFYLSITLAAMVPGRNEKVHIMENAVTSGQGRDVATGGPGPRSPGSDGQFFTTVNGEMVKFKDSTPKGERILEKAGFVPPADHALIQLLRHS